MVEMNFSNKIIGTLSELIRGYNMYWLDTTNKKKYRKWSTR